MALRVSYSNSLAAAVRGYLGLSQKELGRWLGVAITQVSDVEAGHKRFGEAAQAHLRLLAGCLPAALPALTAYAAPPPPPADPLPPAQAPPPVAPLDTVTTATLTARRRTAEVEAARVAQTLATHQRHAEMVARWTAALPALRAAVPALAPTVQPRATRWLDFRTAELAATGPPPAQTALLALRLALLQAEAATLRVWLGA